MDNLKEVVRALDDDNGVSEKASAAIVGKVRQELGVKSANILSDSIDATDGRFYIKEGEFEQVWAAVEAAAE